MRARSAPLIRAHAGADDDDARADGVDGDGRDCVASHSRVSHERARCATVRARDGVIGGAGVERVPVAHAALRRWDVGEARTASGGASRGGAAGV